MVYSQVLQNVLRRLDRAFKALVRGDSNYPKFKKHEESGSFTYPQAYRGSVRLDAETKRILLSKIGRIKIVVHRQIPPGKLKTCTIKREPAGEWYACLVYDVLLAATQEPNLESSGGSIGIDLGLKSLITTSDGTKIQHPHFLRRAEKRLKRLQRGLAKKERGSANRRKAKRLLAVQYSRVANQRRDFNHKLSAKLVGKYSLIAFEELQVENMLANHGLAKSISDAGWAQLIGYIRYKAAKLQKLGVKVQAAYSTQECCFCGVLNNITLDIRQYECRGCGKTLDRDINGARIVLKRAIAQVGQDKGSSSPRSSEENLPRTVPELKPAEVRPPLTHRMEPASPIVETGTVGGGGHAAQKPATGSPRHSSVGGCHFPSPRCRPCFTAAATPPIAAIPAVPVPA